MPTELSERQNEVLAMLAQGYTSTTGPPELHMAKGTWKAHVQAILNRLGAVNTAHAVAIGYERGLLP